MNGVEGWKNEGREKAKRWWNGEEEYHTDSQMIRAMEVI